MSIDFINFMVFINFYIKIFIIFQEENKMKISCSLTVPPMGNSAYSLVSDRERGSGGVGFPDFCFFTENRGREGGCGMGG